MTATDLVKRPLGGAKVLVAEADPDDAVALTAVLRLNGFDAREARTADAALAAAAAAGRPGGGPRPGRRRPVRAHPPGAAAGGAGGRGGDRAHGRGGRRAAAEAGAAAYLLKPADPVELARLVGRLSRGQDDVS